MEMDKELKQVAPIFFDSLKIVLESRSRQLPVESLLLEILYQKEVMSILPYLDPKSLKILDIGNARWRKSRGHSIKTNKIVQLEQWKRAEELGLLYFTVTIPIENLFHASKLSINLEKISAKEVFLLKEAFMNSSNFSNAFINYNQFNDQRSLIKYLGTPFDDFVEFGAARRRWFYRIPENDQEALCVHFRRFSIFHFERIALCSVPENCFEGELNHMNS